MIPLYTNSTAHSKPYIMHNLKSAPESFVSRQRKTDFIKFADSQVLKASNGERNRSKNMYLRQTPILLISLRSSLTNHFPSLHAIDCVAVVKRLLMMGDMDHCPAICQIA